MTGSGKNLLVSCGGKWVGITLQLREALRRQSGCVEGRVIVASSDKFTAAGAFADAAFVVPLIADPGYIDAMLDICAKNSVAVLVPLIDLDLARLAPHNSRFAEIGTTVVCPSPDVVDLCFDKLLFAQFATANKLPHPITRTLDDLSGLTFPAFRKTRRGFGSIGAGVCRSPDDAAAAATAIPDLIFQEYLPGPEYTVDAYIARSGRCVVCVPRLRDKVVAGEAYQSHTVRDAAISNLAMRTIDALAMRGLRGPLNVQILAGSAPVVLEVNTRLGSASVLSNIASGGRLFDAVMHEALGGTAEGDPGDYIEGMMLTRFLGDVFHTAAGVTAIRPG